MTMPSYCSLSACWHACGFVNLHLDDRDLVCEREGEDQHPAFQFPFRLILHVGHLDFDGHWTLISAQKLLLGHEAVLGLQFLRGRLVFHGRLERGRVPRVGRAQKLSAQSWVVGKAP